MRITQSILEALQSLSANKVRSLLTVLGVVIGVAAVIAMLSVGNGATASIKTQIESVGTNLVYVTPGAVRQSGISGAAGTAGTLTQDDADALTQIDNVSAVAPEIDTRAQVTYMGVNANTRVIGTTPDYATMRNYTLSDGDFISDSNLSSRSMVVVLGSAVADELFGGSEGAVGQSIRLNSQQFKVIGVLESKGGTGFNNQDDQVIIPMTTAQYRLVGRNTFRGANTINTINVQVNNAKNVTAVMSQITTVLRERHNTAEGSDDFTVSSQQDALTAISEVTSTLTIFLGGIAGISLLVGGIGIMNIMLTTVSERTREIGLRKAIGARRRDILTQFLLEAVGLSVIGGIVGTGLGVAIAKLVGQVSLGGSAITPVVTADSVVLATVFSLVVGLFFGIYPAARAARLQPVEALRYE